MTLSGTSTSTPTAVTVCRGLVCLQIAAAAVCAALGAVILLPLVVILGVPLVLLRRGRRRSRIALLIVEAVVAFAVTLAAAFAFVFAVLPLVSCVVVIALISSPAATRWAEPGRAGA